MSDDESAQKLQKGITPPKVAWADGRKDLMSSAIVLILVNTGCPRTIMTYVLAVYSCDVFVAAASPRYSIFSFHSSSHNEGSTAHYRS